MYISLYIQIRLSNLLHKTHKLSAIHKLQYLLLRVSLSVYLNHCEAGEIVSLALKHQSFRTRPIDDSTTVVANRTENRYTVRCIAL